MIYRNPWKGMALLACCAGLFLLAGCGSGQKDTTVSTASVKAIKVIRQDIPLTYEYAGQVKGVDEVAVQAKISGLVVEKYVKGGEIVQQGQPLFRIDSRQYESALSSARGEKIKAEVNLRNARRQLERDRKLYGAHAISQKEMEDQEDDVNSYEAELETKTADLEKARQNLNDSMVYAPLSGRLSVDDAAVGTYASAGSTKLVTIDSLDPVYVEFNVSESDYLDNIAGDGSADGSHLTITLGNGKTYPQEGRIVQADRSMDTGAGTLTIKSLFENPDHTLLPGMYARVKFIGKTVPDTLLVPQRAVQQLLNQAYVMTVADDGTAVSKNVTLGQKVGSYYIIESGLDENDEVIVGGLTNLKDGATISSSLVTGESLGLSLGDSVKQDGEAGNG